MLSVARQALLKIPLLHSGLPRLRLLQRLSLLAIAAAYLMPLLGISEGGYSICWLYNTSGLPCPGCGLTRSVIKLFHLDFRDAWFYHPFGIVIACAFLVLALSAFVWPLSNFLERRAKLFYRLFVVFAFFVVLFGVFRIVLLVFFPDYVGDFGIVMHEKRLLDLF